MIKTIVLAATTLASFALAAPAAEASGVARAWVSGKGTDVSGCGAPTHPCRSLQYVHDNIIEAGGEIDVLDAAGYGAITITKSISIVNDGVGVAGSSRRLQVKTLFRLTLLPQIPSRCAA